MPLESSSTTDGSISVTPDIIDNSTQAIFSRFVVSQMLGSNAFGLDEISFGTSDETPDLASTIVNLIVTVVETQTPELMIEIGIGLQAESLDERLEAWISMIELIEKILDGSELAAALLENPLLGGTAEFCSFVTKSWW